ncbi:MAG: hypothetical protein PHR56_05770 [Dehalococcoidales bacterium]|nr:hypothetical protein [Dehalococcoidales bacterium]
MSQKASKTKVALKYCGSCNPNIDLNRAAQYLTELSHDRGDFELVSVSDSSIGVVVILCGCPRACGDKAEVRAIARQSLVVAGENVGGEPVMEKELNETIKQKLGKILSEAGGHSVCPE